jgi:nudix-type nucleoside diphosphatase (YffH/AdpP family)
MHKNARILERKIISQDFGTLEQISYERERSDGEMQKLTREIYNRGDAAAVLLYDPSRQTVILIRQFRLPPYLDGQPEPLIEVCAGKLEGKPPEERIIEEAEEETGVIIKAPRRVLEAFMSPGAFTEKQTLFVAPYSPADRKGKGGGLAEEGEDIEVLELPFADAYAMVERGEIIDAKTIILLQYAKLSGLLQA